MERINNKTGINMYTLQYQILLSKISVFWIDLDQAKKDIYLLSNFIASNLNSNSIVSVEVRKLISSIEEEIKKNNPKSLPNSYMLRLKVKNDQIFLLEGLQPNSTLFDLCEKIKV